MTTPYAWCCLACEATNAADTTRCSRCACPAHATCAQVAAARDAYRRRAGLPAVVAPDPLAILRQLPLLPIAAVVLLLVGALLLMLGMSTSATAFGGLLIALAALCVSSYRRRAPAAG